MLRTLFIENGKNTKKNSFKALFGKIVLKIVKIKILLMVVPLTEVSCLL